MLADQSVQATPTICITEPNTSEDAYLPVKRKHHIVIYHQAAKGTNIPAWITWDVVVMYERLAKRLTFRRNCSQTISLV